MLDFDLMNETDVREIVVRPLLHRLGYQHGTQAHIRTEVTLTYDKAFLGRKKPTKDPVLAGRADYICDAISFGRWVVEVKAPRQTLCRDDVEQAHTYAAHPQVAASYFLLTNGKEFALYATGHLERPLLHWLYEETESKILNLLNVVGYDAFRRLSQNLTLDPLKPLGKGLNSRVEIIGGEITYGEHKADNALFATDVMNGTVGTVTGVAAHRASDGRLTAEISVRSPYQQLAELNKLAGVGNFDFHCSDEYISDDESAPSIFQSVVSGHLDPGARATLFPGLEFDLPFGFNVTAYSDAAGYLDGKAFIGIINFIYDYKIIKGPRTNNSALNQVLDNLGETLRIAGTGSFRVLFS